MKKIAFLFSGQSRCNPLSHNSNKCNTIIDSYNEYVFTEYLKKNYLYDIFISTDDTHLTNTYTYFGIDNVKNLHLLNTGFYKEQITFHIPSEDHFIEKYRKENKDGKCTYESSIYQHYKIYDCFNLLENYTSYTDYDYIIRLRLDTIFDYDISEYIKYLDNNINVHILTRWDFFAIGKPDIMKYYCCSLKNKYGTYNFDTNVDHIDTIEICNDSRHFTDNYKDLKINNSYRWTYPPEIQLFETLLEFCHNNGLDINKTMKDPSKNSDIMDPNLKKEVCFIVR